MTKTKTALRRLFLRPTGQHLPATTQPQTIAPPQQTVPDVRTISEPSAFHQTVRLALATLIPDLIDDFKILEVNGRIAVCLWTVHGTIGSVSADPVLPIPLVNFGTWHYKFTEAFSVLTDAMVRWSAEYERGNISRIECTRYKNLAQMLIDEMIEYAAKSGALSNGEFNYFRTMLIGCALQPNLYRRYA